MQLAQQIKMRQSQSLVMTPQLQQAIKLLQMTNLELCQFLENQTIENPFLENNKLTNIEENKNQNSSESVLNSTSDISKDFANGKSIQDDPGNKNDYENRFDTDIHDRPKLDNPSTIKNSINNEDASNLSEINASKPLTLREHVMKQISLELKEPKERIIATFITDHLQPSGWIDSNIHEIAEEASCSEEKLLNVLEKLQRFEPAGLFARNLAECITIQLKEKNLFTKEFKVLLENLNILAKGEIKQLSKLTGLDQTGISEAISLIRSLNPKPGEVFEFDESYSNSPDVIVSKSNNGWVVELNKSTLPAITINEEYVAEMSKKSRNEKSTNFVSDSVASARWLKRSVEQRNSTTLTIAAAIVAQQEDFLNLGLSHLKPMVLRDIAKEVGMHESTVSRVTTGLTMETPRGCFAMKYFFSVSINSAEDGETHAATAVREAIRKLISEEPPKKPLSDEVIALMIKKDGIDLARRTVAKYREIMKIPSSAQRRRQTRLAALN